MSDEELIKTLRCEFYGDDECDKSDCPIWSELGCRNGIANRAAADALEELQQIADHYEQTAKDYWKEACEYKHRIAELEAKLDEAENSIKNYKDLYLSRKREELLLAQQIPKEGEWIHGREIGKEWNCEYWVTYYEDWHCSNCRVVFEQESKPKYCYCPNCGARMRKGEQE